ncbi:hypothetical protein BC628DRAFT_1342055 [Trametes gibbosa]|nr:hypothetical protein BC628DRAFT_1342055 [Trametes gibbosa]
MQPHMSLHSVLSSPNLSTISSRSNSISPTEVTGIAARQFYMPVHSDQTNPSQSSQGPGFHTRLDTGNQIFQGNQTRQSTPGFMGSGFLSAGGPSVMNRSQSPISLTNGLNARPIDLLASPEEIQQRFNSMQDQIQYLQGMIRSAQQAEPNLNVPGMPLAQEFTRAAAPIPGTTHKFEVDPRGWFLDAPRSHAAFPKVPYWKKSDWNRAHRTSTTPGEQKGKKGPTRMSENENVVFRFITDGEGTVVDGNRIHTICRRFREFCIYLYREGRAPHTWQRGIDAQITVEFHHWMRTQCTELQLCDDDWKADKVAILCNYSQWRKKYVARLARFAAKAKAAKAAKKKATKGKEKALGMYYEPEVADDEDREFEQDLAGASKVRDVLAAAQLRLSPVPEDEAASGTPGPSRCGRSPGSSDDKPASKRQRTLGQTPTTPLSRAPSPPPPMHTSDAPAVPLQDSLVPTAGGPEPVVATKPKVKFRCPLANMEWCPPTSETSTAAGPAPVTESAAIPPPSTAASSATLSSVASDPADTVPASSIPGPSSSSSASNPSVASVTEPTVPVPKDPEGSTVDAAEPKKRAPRPRKVAPFPPPDDKEHQAPKDVCARVWARNNPDGTREEYNLWYKRKQPYHRQLYAATNGARGDEAENKSKSTKTDLA